MARAFNGTSQSLQSAAALSAISGKARIAISFWLNTVYASDDDIVLEYSADSNANAGSFKVIANESGSTEFWVDMLGNVGKANARSSQFGASSVWHHWVINLNFGNAGTTEVESIWRDGTQLATGQDLANNNTGTFGSYVLNVMSRNNSALFCDGSMADLCIWGPTTALAGTDISNLAAGRRASTVRNSEILYYWPLQGTTSPEPASIGTTALTVNGATSATDPPTLDAIGGGSSLTASPADNLGITDSAARDVSAVRAPADPVGITDSVTASLAGNGSATPADPVGITDSVAVVKSVAVSISDNVGITDTGSPITIVVDYSIGDPVGITDSVTVVKSVVRAVSDAVGITDNAGASASGSGTVTDDDPVGISDTAAVVVQAVRQQDDAVGITDTLTAAQSLARTLADAVGITDSVSASLIASGNANLSDGVGISDAVTLVRSLAVQIGDGIGITDQAARTSSVMVTVSDQVGITDLAVAIVGIPVAPDSRGYRVSAETRGISATDERGMRVSPL